MELNVLACAGARVDQQPLRDSSSLADQSCVAIGEGLGAAFPTNRTRLWVVASETLLACHAPPLLEMGWARTWHHRHGPSRCWHTVGPAVGSRRNASQTGLRKQRAVMHVAFWILGSPPLVTLGVYLYLRLKSFMPSDKPPERPTFAHPCLGEPVGWADWRFGLGSRPLMPCPPRAGGGDSPEDPQRRVHQRGSGGGVH